MENHFIFILTIIKLYFCCDDISRISLLPPFHDLQNIQTALGEDIILVCCHPDGASSLNWEDKTGRVISFTTNAGIFSLKDEKRRLILRIDNIRPNGLGIYTCKNQARGISRSVTISQKLGPMPPKITKIELLFPKNKPIKIKCPLTERQTFKTWTFTEGGRNILKNKASEGINYEISDDRLIFIVKMDSNIEPIKVVWCQYQEVTVDGDLLVGLYELTWVLYDPIDVRITMENLEPILESDDVKLVCDFNEFQDQISSFPSNNMKSTFIKKVESNRIALTIPKITKDLEGQYDCKVTKSLSQNPIKVVEETASIQVNVIVPPKIIKNKLMEATVKLHDNAFLKCDIINKHLDRSGVVFERFITADSAWVKLDENEDRYETKLISKDEKHYMTLTIKNIGWDDRGKYRCSASNAAGKDTYTGLLKVEKSPDLYSTVDNIYMAMEPIKVDCSVSGFPISNTSDFLELRIVNETSNILLRLLELKYDEMEGMRLFYEVAVTRKLVEEEIYLLECFYHNELKKYKKTKFIEVKIASKPHVPKVEIICSGTSGVVFRYTKLPLENTPKDVMKNELFYGPSAEYESLIKKPSKIIPINYQDQLTDYIFVLRNLFPFTNYTFKWESYNKFQISSFMSLFGSTKRLSPPPDPKNLEFSLNGNLINVKVTWNDDCPYEGANSQIKDVIVNMKPLAVGHNKVNLNWNWVQTNITVSVEEKNLQFPISLEKPNQNYEIKVALRSMQGRSKFIKSVYKADVVLSGKLFACITYCSGQSLSFLLMLPLSLIVFIGFLFNI